MISLKILLFFILAGVINAYEFKVTFLKPLHFNHIDVTVNKEGCRYTMNSANIIGVNNGTFISTSCNSQLYPDVSVYSSPKYEIQYIITSIGDKYDCRLIKQNIGKADYICSLSGTRSTIQVTATTTRRTTQTKVVTTTIFATKTRRKIRTKTNTAATYPSDNHGSEYNKVYCLAKTGCIDSCGNNICSGATQANSASIPYATRIFRQ